MSIAPLLARVIETERTIRDKENMVPEKRTVRYKEKDIVAVAEEDDEYVMDEKSSD